MCSSAFRFHKLQRYIWCRQHINTNFKDYVFADETTVRILEIPLYHTRKKGERPDAHCSTSKIRMKGPTPFVVINLTSCTHLHLQFTKCFYFSDISV